MDNTRTKFINELERIKEERFGTPKTYTQIFVGAPLANSRYIAYTHSKVPINNAEKKRKQKALNYIDAFEAILEGRDVDYEYAINSFWALSELLEKSNLNIQETLSILSWFVEYNDQNGSLEEGLLFLDAELLEKTVLKTITLEELVDLIQNRKLVDFLFDESKNRTALEQAQREEIIEKLDSMDRKCEKEIESLRKLRTHLIKNKNITEEDKQIILGAFKDLRVRESILAKVEMALDKMIEESTKFKIEEGKKINTQGKQEVQSKPKTAREKYLKSEKTYLTNKEYKMIRKRIYETYDLRTGTLMKETITYEEMMDCLADIYILGEDESQMIRFLNLCKTVIPFKEDIMEKYRLLRDPLIKTLGTAFVAPLDEYVEMIEIDLNKEANERALKRELEKLLKFIPRHFIYEIEAVKERVKTR